MIPPIEHLQGNYMGLLLFFASGLAITGTAGIRYIKWFAGMR